MLIRRLLVMHDQETIKLVIETALRQSDYDGAAGHPWSLAAQ